MSQRFRWLTAFVANADQDVHPVLSPKLVGHATRPKSRYENIRERRQLQLPHSL